MLIIAHREELLEQARDKISRSNPDLKVQIEQASLHADPDADIVVASVQTIAKSECRRLMRFDLTDFRMVVIDEAHHATAKSYVTVLQAFGLLPPDDFLIEEKPDRESSLAERLAWQRSRLAGWDAQGRPNCLLLGVTATPTRGDKIGLEAVFQQSAYSMTIRDGIEQGFLAPIRAYRVLTDRNLDTVATRAGDFALDQLSSVVDDEGRNRLAVKSYLEYAPDRKAVAFAVDVAHAKHMAECFNASGISAEVVYGDMATQDRRRILSGFTSGQYRVLTNAMLLTEGWDEPSVNCIIQARPTKSQSLYVQMAGRGTRLFDGKDDCILIDLVDIARKHSLITSAELVGLPANFDAKGQNLLDAAKKLEEAKESHPSLNTEDIRSLEELDVQMQEVDLWQSHTLPEILEHSTLSWRKSSAGEYVVTLQSDNHKQERMVISQTPNGWKGELDKYGQRTVLVNEVPSLEQAFQESESWAKRMRSYSVRFVDRNAGWRKQLATDGQKMALAQMKVPANFKTITKGEATDLIDHVRYEQSLKYAKRNRFAVIGKKSA
jgi:superfamily II DNA or RNA helicase